MRIEIPSDHGGKYVEGGMIKTMKNGFILAQNCHPKNPEYKGDFAIYTTAPDAVVDYTLFRGAWFDGRWQHVRRCPVGRVLRCFSLCSLEVKGGRIAQCPGFVCVVCSPLHAEARSGPGGP